jgi:hypothetical protein
MRKGLILLTAVAATLGSVAVATPASAQYYGHDHGHHGGWHGDRHGYHDHGRDRWRHERDWRWHHHRHYDRGYYGHHYRGW